MNMSNCEESLSVFSSGLDLLGKVDTLFDFGIKLGSPPPVPQELRVHTFQGNILLLFGLLYSIPVALGDLVLVGVVFAFGHS